METNDDQPLVKPNETLTARSYQIELLNHVSERNSIVCMGTGTGKTFIAVMLIREKAHEIEKPYQEGGKRTFFLTSAVALARQQGEVLKQHTNLRVQTYVGADGVDDWMTKAGRWEVELERNQVLVMTAQILFNLLQHGLIGFSRINLIIFDECHHAKKNHAYAKIMVRCREAMERGEETPHILGLTASILDKDVATVDVLETNMIKIEKTLLSTAITSADTEAMEMYGTKPEEFILECNANDQQSQFFWSLDQVVGGASDFLRYNEMGYKRRKVMRNDELVDGPVPVAIEEVLKELDEYRVVLQCLGPIAAAFVAERSLTTLNKYFKAAPVPVAVNKRFYALGGSVFGELIKMFDDYENENIRYLEDAESHCAPKVRKFIKDVLYQYCEVESIAEIDNPGPDMDLEEDDALDEFEMEIDDDDDDEDDDDDDENEEIDAVGDSDDDGMGEENATPPNENLTGIVFVERRIISFALHKLLERFFGWDTTLACIKSGYIVGAGGTGETKDVHHTMKRQEVTLRHFRNKDLNLLISTSVLQEGIDIPKCNLVVLFDAPKNYREYIQAKGRARAEKSKFYVLVNEYESEECATKIKKYQEFESFIASKCLNREGAKTDEVDDDDDYSLPPYKGPVLDEGKQAMVTMSSAVGLINLYCSHLPADSYTRLAATCTYKEFSDNNGVLTFQCTMQLPITSPVREPVTGPIMPRKKLAQMATALKICELLHQAKELNDHLLPAFTGVETPEEVLTEILRGPGGQLVDVGASKTEPAAPKTKAASRSQKLYEKAFPAALADCLPKAGQRSYLYEIAMKLTAVVKGHPPPRFRVDQSPRQLGLLLSKPLPDIPEFSIFIGAGEIAVNVRHVGEIVLDEKQLETALTYHRYAVRKILNIERESFVSIMFNPSQGVRQEVLVPIVDGDVDWQFLEVIVANQDIPYHALKKKEKFEWNRELWEDAVVSRTYREPPAYYIINEICTDMTPYSQFPNDDYSTFLAYYRERYELRIKNKTQPLLDVVSTSKRMDLITPRFQTRMGDDIEASKRERHLTHFVPELCGRHPLPGTVWQQILCIPSILFRISSLLNAAELKEKVSRETGLFSTPRPAGHSYPRLDFGYKLQVELRPMSDDVEMKEDSENDNNDKMDFVKEVLNIEASKADAKKEEEKRRNELERIERISLFAPVLDIPDATLGPSPCHLLHALTLAAANDNFNLERMEIMGDSFLKYVITVYLFRKYPDIHEGKLTSRRTQLTNNATLHKLGCEKKIDQFIISKQFAPSETWLPPCYAVKEIIPEIQEGKRGEEDQIVTFSLHTQHLMYDKNVADCIEALIGCFLMTSGAHAAEKFINWLGLNTDLGPMTSLPDPVHTQVPNWQSVMEKETANLQSFEESIQYKFKNKAYLLEALTHSSYDKNRITGNYQRLEFLGDAVLDYVLTRFLFEDCRQHSPGLMTDIRSALVNNNIFAKLAVKFGYHLSFKYLNPSLFYVIDRFVKAQRELGDVIQADMESELDDDIEIPKALGDVFESVAGAIYLDSGFSLDTVWAVHYRMMKDLIVSVTMTLPKSPIRELMELRPACIVFSRPMRLPSGKTKVVVRDNSSGKEYKGIGKNHRLARVVAARNAVKGIKEIMSQGLMVSMGRA